MLFTIAMQFTKNPDSLIRFRVDAVFEQLVYCNFEKEVESWSYTSGSISELLIVHSSNELDFQRHSLYSEN